MSKEREIDELYHSLALIMGMENRDTDVQISAIATLYRQCLIILALEQGNKTVEEARRGIIATMDLIEVKMMENLEEDWEAARAIKEAML